MAKAINSLFTIIFYLNRQQDFIMQQYQVAIIVYTK